MADLRNIEYNGVTFTLPTGGGAGTLGDLSDVGLSTSPPAGALLGFDGTEWKDVELTGGGSGGLTEYEALTGVKNMLDVGSYPYIGVNNDGSLRVPATGSGGAILTITRDFYLADYGLAQGDKVIVTGIPSGCTLKHARYSSQSAAGRLSSDPATWTISAEAATEGRIVLTLDVTGNFAGANAKIMFRKDGIASSEFQPFALGNAALTSSLRYLTEQLGCKNLLPAYQSGNGFTVAADGGITVPINALSDKRFVIASGLIDNGTVKAGQQYYLSGIDAKVSAQTIFSSLTFEYELGGATQTITAALATDTLVDIPEGATGGSVVLTRLGSAGNTNTNTVYPMLRDARMADAQYQKPAAFPYSSLASLSDVGTANTAGGNILTFDGTSWTNGTLTGNSGVSVSRTGANYTLTGDAAWAKTQAINAPLTGLNTSQGGAVTAADTVLSAIGKLQNGLTSEQSLTYQTISGDYLSAQVTRCGRIAQLTVAGKFIQDVAQNAPFVICTVPEGYRCLNQYVIGAGFVNGGELILEVYMTQNGVVTARGAHSALIANSDGFNLTMLYICA